MIGSCVDAADEALAAERGQHVVAPAPLRDRHVDLEPVLEAEQRLRDRPVVDEPVERREERGTPGERSIEQLRLDAPAASNALDGGLDTLVPDVVLRPGPDDAHRAKSAPGADPVGLLGGDPRRVDRQDPLGEVPQPLVADPGRRPRSALADR